MAGQGITYDFTSRGADQLARDFKSTGDSAALAAKGARLLADSLERQRKASDVSAGATLALAKADKILSDAEHVLSDKALEADFALKRQADGYVTLSAKGRRAMDELGAKADELRAAWPDLTLKINTAEAKAKLDLFAAESKVKMDEINRELSGSGSGGGLLSKIGGLFSGGGSSSSASPASGLLSSPAGLGVAAGGIGLGAALLPGIAGLGIGGGVGLGAIAGGLFGASQGKTVLAADTATIKQITTGLKTAIGGQRKILSADLVAANKQFAKDSAFYAPFLAFQKSLKGFAQTLLAPLRGIMTPLAGIVTQFGKGLTALAPQFTALFKASLPFIRQFAAVMLQSGKILMPAFTQAMNTMVKSGALKEMTQGLVILVTGFAKFTVALGPGMKSSAKIFTDLMVITAAALQGVGKTASWLANVIENFAHRWRVQFDRLTTSLDAWRHDFSAVFIRVNTDLNNWRHGTAVIFDGVRHDIAAVWDTIWNNTVGRVKRGISDVVGWFRGLPGRAVGALTGMGHSLGAFAAAALNEMWSGFKRIGGGIVSWFGNFGRSILNTVKKIWGILSPSSAFAKIGDSLMEGLAVGIKRSAGKAHRANTAAAKALGGFPKGGSTGPGAAAAQAWMRAHMGDYGWSAAQFPPLQALWNHESGWRWNAQNPTSPAYGIPQSDPGSKMAAAGADWRTNPVTQMRWGAEYIRATYGNPANAWAFETSHTPNWYGGGLDAIFRKPTLIGVGERGPEHVMVTPRGSAQKMAVELVVRTAHGATDMDRAIVAIIQKFVTIQGGDVQSALGRT